MTVRGKSSSNRAVHGLAVTAFTAYLSSAMQRRQFLRLFGLGGAVAAGGVGEARGLAFLHDRSDLGRAESSNYGGMRTGAQQIVWSLPVEPSSPPTVALTFDDGPTARFTPRVLDALAAVDARATFFFIGRNVNTAPDLARRVRDAGHEIANHTWSHPSLAVVEADRTLDELRRGTAAIREATGVNATWFRPPRGQLTGTSMRYAADLGQQVAMWSVTRGGSQIGDNDHDAVVVHLLEQIRPGSIVDLHDGLGRAGFSPGSSMAKKVARRREAEMIALPTVLQDLRARGYRFVTLSEAMRSEAENSAPSA